jgi:hypothetical protein
MSQPLNALRSGHILPLKQPFTNFQARSQSTYRRIKQRLRIRPNESFLLTTDSPTQDHIIYNPPSSAPSNMHTPVRFMPKFDKRNNLADKLKPGPSATLAPPVQPTQEKLYHLSKEQAEEIRRLRAADPAEWTRKKLAARFNCSPIFIGLISRSPTEFRMFQDQKLEAVKMRWGSKRRLAREDRSRRRESWLSES